MSEGLKAAYIENRKAVYGEWEQVFLDMDEGSVKVAEENPFLAQTGKISIYGAIEYSCAMKSHFRKFGNQMSGSGNHLCNYASLLA